jgi:hypothetical protein
MKTRDGLTTTHLEKPLIRADSLTTRHLQRGLTTTHLEQRFLRRRASDRSSETESEEHGKVIGAQPIASDGPRSEGSPKND